MDKKFGELVANQVLHIRQTLEQQQGDGYYIIPDISLADYQNEKVRVLNMLLFILTAEYPQYSWWTTESYSGPGLRVNWRRK